MSGAPIFGTYIATEFFYNINGVDEVVSTQLDIGIENVTKTIWPNGAPSEAEIWVGRKFTISADRNAVDEHMLVWAVSASPSSGVAGTLKAATSFTAGTAIPMTTPNTIPAQISATLAADPMTAGGSLLFIGVDVNGNPYTETVLVNNGDPAGTVYQTKGVFICNEVLPIGCASLGTLVFASVAGATSGNDSSPPMLFPIMAKATKLDGSGRKVWFTFNNCAIKKTGISSKGGSDISTKVEFYMRNPTVDFSWQAVSAS
jgi:hypothetical protein